MNTVPYDTNDEIRLKSRPHYNCNTTWNPFCVRQKIRQKVVRRAAAMQCRGTAVIYVRKQSIHTHTHTHAFAENCSFYVMLYPTLLTLCVTLRCYVLPSTPLHGDFPLRYFVEV